MIEDNDLPVGIDDNDSYRKARQFWMNLMYQLIFERDSRVDIRQFIDKKTNFSITSNRVRKFINVKQFENLSNESDGNPIYLCEFGDISKSLRIIQEAPTGDNLEIGAWINAHDEFRRYDELVLSLELNEQSYKVAKALVYYWLFVSNNVDDMNELIDRLW